MKQKALYGIGIVFALVLLVGIAVLPFVAFRYLGFSETEARLLGSSLAAASTFGLVIVTYITVRQNQQIVERQEKELEKERQKEFVDDVILPTKEIIEGNVQRMLSKDKVVRWTWDNGVVPGHVPQEEDTHNLHQVCQREDIDSSEIKSFKSEYLEVYELLEKHDRKLAELKEKAEGISEEFLDKYSIQYESLSLNPEIKLWKQDGGGSVGDRDSADKDKLTIDLALSDATERDFDYYSLDYIELSDYSEYMVVNTQSKLGDKYTDFVKLRNEYIQFAEFVSSELEELRRDISEQYRV